MPDSAPGRGDSVVSAELIGGAICGLLIALLAITSYWFYTLPARYRANREKLRQFEGK